MEKKIEIQRVAITDVEALQEIARQTFYEAFSEVNTDQNMRHYLSEAFSVEKMTAELNNKDSEFYFASLQDRVIGYLKLNLGQAQTDIKDEKALEIERIYILKEFYGRNVGQLLYEKAIQVAKHKNVNYVWLGVWEENSRAISFYKKNGFVEFDKHLFKLGDDEQTDLMMKKSLKGDPA